MEKQLEVMPVMAVIDYETGEIINKINQGDKVRVTRKEYLDYMQQTMKVDNKEQFIKLYTSVLEDLIEEDLTAADFKIILVCLQHLNYYSGAVVYKNNGNFLNSSDLEKLSTLSKRKVIDSINKLADLKIIHKGRTGKENQIYLNPFIFMKGSEINSTLYMMFKNSKWARKMFKELNRC